MVKGWFIGPFTPSVFQTDRFELAIKSYSANDTEPSHYHLVSTEITAIISGSVEMAGIELKSGDIIIIEPGEPTSFTAKSDATTVVVKFPACHNDKYLC